MYKVNMTMSFFTPQDDCVNLTSCIAVTCNEVHALWQGSRVRVLPLGGAEWCGVRGLPCMRSGSQRCGSVACPLQPVASWTQSVALGWR